MNEQITLSIGSAQRTATVVSDSGCIEVPGKGFVRFYVVSGMVWEPSGHEYGCVFMMQKLGDSWTQRGLFTGTESEMTTKFKDLVRQVRK